MYDRLILYYPVSALVTLFANILQNPQDVRARGDLRLMSSVCSFLTMLERDAQEANGNVRRMLSVCSEFERIAKVVLDKAERDMKGRGKRKQAEREKERERKWGDGVQTGLDEGKTLEMMQVETQKGYRRPVQTPSLRRSMESSAQGSPNGSGSWGGSPAPGNGTNGAPPRSLDMVQEGIQTAQPPFQAPPMQTSSGQWNGHPRQHQQQHQPYLPNGGPNNPFPQDFLPSDSTSFQAPPGISDFNPSFSPPNVPGMDLNAPFPVSNADGVPSGAGAFQQPFVPQDLWQMPMTLEWDWAEGLGLGSFTPGGMWDGFGGGSGGGGMMGEGGQG